MDCHFRLPREDEPGSVVTAYVGGQGHGQQASAFLGTVIRHQEDEQL